MAKRKPKPKGPPQPPDRPEEAPDADKVPDVELPKSTPDERGFTPEILDRTVIAIPLLKILKDEQEEQQQAQKSNRAFVPKPIPVIIDLNLEHHQGRAGARQRVE